MGESKFQSELIKTLEDLFPGCLVFKNDPGYRQGVPDLLILYRDKWAALEVKASRRAKKQPNQDYYVDRMDDMAFAAYIYPENEAEVLDALQQTFRTSRTARLS